MRGARWVEQVREVPIAEVLGAVGCTQGRSGRWSPCPLCGEARERSDRRGPIGLMRGRQAGLCNVCHAPIDAIAVARAQVGLGGDARLDGAGWLQVRGWCADRGWCDRPEGWTGGESRVERVRVAPPPPREYAPVWEAAATWERRTVGVLEDAAAVAWLADRVAREGDGDAIDVMARIEADELARVLRLGASLPRWARCQGYSWSQEGWHDGRGEGAEEHRGAPVGWRLVMRAWGADGRLLGLRARSLWVGERHAAHRKEISPYGGLPSGAVYGCARAQSVLAGAPAADWSGVVIVREGGPDWLLTAASAAIADAGHAVVGMWSGSLGGEGGRAWARRLAEVGASVVVATDADEAGDGYAAQILALCEVAGVSAARGGR